MAESQIESELFDLCAKLKDKHSQTIALNRTYRQTADRLENTNHSLHLLSVSHEELRAEYRRTLQLLGASDHATGVEQITLSPASPPRQTPKPFPITACPAWLRKSSTPHSPISPPRQIL